MSDRPDNVCPECGERSRFDHIVDYCDACGYCAHTCLTDDVCDKCGAMMVFIPKSCLLDEIKAWGALQHLRVDEILMSIAGTWLRNNYLEDIPIPKLPSGRH